jgi:chromosomal replication initiation ATPase DnaA
MSTAQLPLPLSYRPALDRENFIVAPGNAEALDTIEAWPRWPGRALVLSGPAGSGKTHLAAVFALRSAAARLAACEVSATKLRELIRRPALILEDVDSGSLDEHALFHLFNLIIENERFLLLTGRSAPAHWPIKLADLKSRLMGALHLRLGEPDDILLEALIRKHLADRQIVPHDNALVPYLLNHIERSAEGARRIVDKLDKAALGSGRRVGLKLAVDILAAEQGPADPEKP